MLSRPCELVARYIYAGVLNVRWTCREEVNSCGCVGGDIAKVECVPCVKCLSLVYLKVMVISPPPVKPEGTIGLHSVCPSVCLSVCPSH